METSCAIEGTGLLRELLGLYALDVLKHQYKYRYNCILPLYLSLICLICTSRPLLRGSVLWNCLKRWGKSLRETSLMRLWLGSDRTISRNLGLLIPHSVLNSLYFIFFFFARIRWQEKQGGSPTNLRNTIQLLLLHFCF